MIMDGITLLRQTDLKAELLKMNPKKYLVCL